MKHVEIIQGDALSTLRAMPAGTVDCCVTSPPYWGLRDYGTAGQIGLEVSPDAWCARLVEVFMEVHRVLAPTGTLWINLGDIYATNRKGSDGERSTLSRQADVTKRSANNGAFSRSRWYGDGVKNKDLVGLPWMLAFALRSAGWWLRADLVWEKPNAMPESCRDRPTRSHDYLFLLTKGPRYYFDRRAISETASPNTHARAAAKGVSQSVRPPHSGRGGTHSGDRKRPARFSVGGSRDSHIPSHTLPGVNPKAAATDPRDHHGVPRANSHFSAAVSGEVRTRNARTVWRIPTQPRHEAHFASFPDELPRRCILAGCPEGGLVLDPFAGRGTTLIVARELRRRAVGIELNPEYVEMTRANLARSAS